MTRSLDILTVGVLLALLTAALLALAKLAEVPSGVTQVVMIISGIAAMGALTAFQRFIESDKGSPLVHITFNEMFLSRIISEGLPKFEAAPAETEQGQAVSPSPWDLSAGQLIGTDNALALARLRMDVERELRRIAYEAQIDLSIRPVGVTGLTRELVNREILPGTFLEALQEIVKVCNRGIHGEEVPGDIAAAVVRVGGQLLERLRLLPRHSKQRQQRDEATKEEMRKKWEQFFEAAKRTGVDPIDFGVDPKRLLGDVLS
jgi:hypothetical protein